jgi:hypothetical protein
VTVGGRGVLVGLVLCVGARGAAAQTATLTPLPASDAVTVRGFVLASGYWNGNDPPSKLNGLHVFDYKTNQLVFDVADVAFAREAVHRGEVGFHFEVEAGETVPMVTAAAGLFRNDVTGQAGHVDVPEAYVRYLAPVGTGLQIDGGKFLAPLGYENIESRDRIQDNASRSILFAFATPMTLTGLRVGYTASPLISAQALVVTGWDRVTDQQSSPTYGGQVELTPTPRLSLALGVLTGPEQRDDTRDIRTVFDLILSWQISTTTRFALNADEGREDHASPTGGLGNWHGYAAYLHHDLSPRVAVSVRGELFHDVNGARTGVSQQLGEVTVTPTVRVREWLTLRSELRVDDSSARIFQSSTGPQRTQVTAALNALVTF